MLDFSEVNERIAALEDEERKTRQALERRREERKRLELRIKEFGEKAEKNRVHKMIVLGGTIYAEMRKWKGGEALCNKLLDMPDSTIKWAGEKISDGYATFTRNKENSDSV